MTQLILVTGPSRSGKSEWAENLALQSGKPVIYVATATIDPHDLEWKQRIEQHQQRRPREWVTLDVPVDLATTIRNSDQHHCLLVDSLGTWVTNLLAQDETIWTQTLSSFLASLQETNADLVIFVAEETGWGLVPAVPIGRLFRDRLGTLVRHLGAIANPVYLVLGGHILNLSDLGFPLLTKFPAN